MKRISRRIYSHGCSDSQVRRRLEPSPGKMYTDTNHHVTKSPYLCPCYTSRPEFIFSSVLPQVSSPRHCARSAFSRGKGPASFKVLCKFSNVLRGVLHPHDSPTPSIYKNHVGVFFICNRIRHFDCNCTATRHSPESVEAGAW